MMLTWFTLSLLGEVLRIFDNYSNTDNQSFPFDVLAQIAMTEEEEGFNVFLIDTWLMINTLDQFYE